MIRLLRFTVLGLLFLFSTETSAQNKFYLGLQANPIYCQPKGQHSFSSNHHIEGAYSFMTGLRADYFHKSGFGLGLGVQYVKKTFEFTHVYYDTMWYTQRRQWYRPQYHTIEVPIMLSYKISAGENLGIILTTGISESVAFTEKEPEVYTDLTLATASGTFGNTFSASAGLMIKTDKSGTFRLGYTYHSGFKGLFGVQYPIHPTRFPYGFIPEIAYQKMDFMSYDIIWYFLD